MDELKKEFINHLHEIDKSKLSIYDLKTYAEILKIMDEIELANKPNEWAELLATMTAGGFGPAYKPVELKEVA